jgi:hypothetical protein
MYVWLIHNVCSFTSSLLYCEVIEGNRLLTAQSGIHDPSDYVVVKGPEGARVPDYSRRYQASLIHVVFIYKEYRSTVG